MPIDYHIHTKMCGHAGGEMEEYLAVAQRKGLVEIGFSDHLPLYFLSPEQRPVGYAMGPEDLPDYVASVERLREKAGSVRIKLGVEADYVPGFTQQLSNVLQPYDFDYITGSVHFVDGWSFDNEEEIGQYDKWDLAELYEKYFTTLKQAANSGFFDVMAHPDLIKKFGFVPETNLTALYEDTVGVFKKAGVCIEVNTAGLRYPAGEIYPAPAFLQLAVQQGVPVTLGSDAHKPEQVGSAFTEAVAMLKGFGCSEISVFNRRKRTEYRI